MHPFLVDWTLGQSHFRIPMYGAMLALAFTAAYFESLRRAIKLEENPKHIENLFLIVVLSSVIGSRLFHVLFEEPAYYFANPGKILAVWEGGYTFYGAMLLSTAAIFVYSFSKKINYLQFGDIAASSTALGLFFGRMGCFFAGCCWGRPSDLPWAVTFIHPNSFTTARNIALHPTQLYESFSCLLLFIYLQWRFSHRKYLGQVFFEALALYSIIRFGVEFFRGDEYRGFVLKNLLSYSQLISLVILPFALIGMFIFSRSAQHAGTKNGKKQNQG